VAVQGAALRDPLCNRPKRPQVQGHGGGDPPREDRREQEQDPGGLRHRRGSATRGRSAGWSSIRMESPRSFIGSAVDSGISNCWRPGPRRNCSSTDPSPPSIRKRFRCSCSHRDELGVEHLPDRTSATRIPSDMPVMFQTTGYAGGSTPRYRLPCGTITVAKGNLFSTVCRSISGASYRTGFCRFEAMGLPWKSHRVRRIDSRPAGR